MVPINARIVQTSATLRMIRPSGLSFRLRSIGDNPRHTLQPLICPLGPALMRPTVPQIGHFSGPFIFLHYTLGVCRREAKP